MIFLLPEESACHLKLKQDNVRSYSADPVTPHDVTRLMMVGVAWLMSAVQGNLRSRRCRAEEVRVGKAGERIEAVALRSFLGLGIALLGG